MNRPRFWLEAITEHAATHTSSPDFGYALTSRKTGSLDGLDLSSIFVARSSGEPVRPSTIRTFSDRFALAGFSERAFAPSYGLAEATLTVTTVLPNELPRFLAVSRAGLSAGTAVPATSEADCLELTSCGRPLADTRVTICDDDGSQLEEGRVGEVRIAGPQVVVEDGASDQRATGDLGFMQQGELFLVGRARERFQVNGENYYANDIEMLVSQASELLRAGRTAVVLHRSGPTLVDRVIVVAEWRNAVDRAADSDLVSAGRAVMSAVARLAGLTVHEVVVVPAGSLPVTTSGKVQRDVTLDGLLSGKWPGSRRIGRGGVLS